MEKKDWLNRFQEEDGSWIDDFRELLKGKSPLRNALIEQFAYEVVEYLDHIEYLHGKCESPIEAKFFEALIKMAPRHGMPVVFIPNELFVANQGEAPTHGLVILPQHELSLSKNYRADFLLMTLSHKDKTTRRLIVECDGHDYHERTKDQAKRDKNRDREMTAAGYPIMRFTGSEIHKDADECADQVCGFLTRYR